MTAINKFNKSLLYTIRSPHTDKYYIGSTTQILCKRFGDHKRHYNQYLNGKDHFITSYKIIELGDAYIELLEEINCENRNQLEKREGELIREHKADCVNQCIAGRTRKEYYEENNDKILEKKKQYRIDNFEKVQASDKKFYYNNIEKMKEKHDNYYKTNSNKIKERQREYNLINKEKINEKQREYTLINKEKINERSRIKRAQQKLVKDLKTITI